MPSGQHSHAEKYITRIVKLTTMSGENMGTYDFLEKICEVDGVIFQKTKITMEEFKGN